MYNCDFSAHPVITANIISANVPRDEPKRLLHGLAMRKGGIAMDRESQRRVNFL